MSHPRKRDDEHAQLRTAREAARHAAHAAADLLTFAERMSPVLDPAQEAEYAALLARDEEARADRQEAFDALGLSVPSLEEES
jgi:type VI protein secretion system component VasF